VVVGDETILVVRPMRLPARLRTAVVVVRFRTNVTAEPPPNHEWLSREISRAREFLAHGDIRNCVRVLVAAEREATARGHTDFLREIGAVADEASRRSSSATRRQAQRIADRASVATPAAARATPGVGAAPHPVALSQRPPLHPRGRVLAATWIAVFAAGVAIVVADSDSTGVGYLVGFAGVALSGLYVIVSPLLNLYNRWRRGSRKSGDRDNVLKDPRSDTRSTS
jgi:hypothetical protein